MLIVQRLSKRCWRCKKIKSNPNLLKELEDQKREADKIRLESQAAVTQASSALKASTAEAPDREGLKTGLKKQREQLKNAQKKVDDLKAEIKRMTEIQADSYDFDEPEKFLDTMIKERTQAQSELESAEEALKAASDTRDKMIEELKSAQARLSEAEANLSTAQETIDLKDAEEQAAQKQEDLESKEAEIADILDSCFKSAVSIDGYMTKWIEQVEEKRVKLGWC